MTSKFLDVKKQLPILGVGMGLRNEVEDETFEHAEQIDWLEIISEQFMGLGGKSRARLDRALKVFPLIAHGVGLSLGSTDEIDQDYIRSLKKLLKHIDAPWWSDHLCFSAFGGVQTHELLPLPFSREAVAHCVTRAKKVQEMTDIPFLLENITYYMRMPGSELDEAQFLSEVLEQADCGLLLDINNVYVNSLNHKFDPIEFMDQIPLERTVQIHIAGHHHAPEFDAYVDTHGATPPRPVLDLLKYVMERVPVNAILLERDQHFPDEFSELLAELDDIRAVVKAAQPGWLDSKSQANQAKTSHRVRG
ncbi:MAG: DUF692 domain-containing protein [Candidatus Obscuribacterales bacterium]